MSETSIWEGFLTRLADGTLKGDVADRHGWVVTLVGTPDRARGGYVVRGYLGETPVELRLPGEDSMRNPT